MYDNSDAAALDPKRPTQTLCKDKSEFAKIA